MYTREQWHTIKITVVSLFVDVWKHNCVWMCVDVRKPQILFLRSCLSWFFEIGRVTGLGITNLARQTGQKAPGFSLCLPSAGIRSTCYHAQLLKCGFWELTSVHSQAACSLSTELSLQYQRSQILTPLPRQMYTIVITYKDTRAYKEMQKQDFHTMTEHLHLIYIFNKLGYLVYCKHSIVNACFTLSST